MINLFRFALPVGLTFIAWLLTPREFLVEVNTDEIVYLGPVAEVVAHSTMATKTCDQTVFAGVGEFPLSIGDGPIHNATPSGEATYALMDSADTTPPRVLRAVPVSRSVVKVKNWRIWLDRVLCELGLH